MNLIEFKKCTLCELSKTRTSVLFGEEDKHAKLMLVALAPGELEDKENKIFIGPSGKILDKLLDYAGISRKEIYITNLIKCNLPQNRRPKQKEIKVCSDYLNEEIKEVDPEILVPLGYFATKYLFEKYSLNEFSKKMIPKLIGKSFPVIDREIYPLSHPASLLYNNEYINEAMKNYYKFKKYNRRNTK